MINFEKNRTYPVSNDTGIDLVERCNDLISQIPHEGNPFFTSDRDRFMAEMRREPKVEDITLNKYYFLAEGFGSFYVNGNSPGYFVGGSSVIFKQTTDEGFIIGIRGTTFTVTSDASFGNRPSTWAYSSNYAEGHIYGSYLENLHILDYQTVISKAEQFLRNLHK